MKRVNVGSVGVDSGMIFVSDPCYISKNKPLSDPKQWDEFCRHRELSPEAFMSMYDGIACQTNGGDGEFPVFVTLDEDNRPTKLEIDLTYEGMAVSDMDIDQADDIQNILSGLKLEDKVELLEKVITAIAPDYNGYTWVNKGISTVKRFKSKICSEKKYQDWWDNRCVWQPDILGDHLSAIYRSAEAYDQAIEFFWNQCDWKDLPESIKNSIRIEFEDMKDDAE